MTEKNSSGRKDHSGSRILLHVCCANCGSSCIKRLQDEGYAVELLYANSNLSDRSEFLKRRHDVARLSELKELPMHEVEYDHKSWLKVVKGLEHEPESGLRCLECFAYNLRKTAQKALELNIPFFTTTLTVSPHKISKNIFRIGEKLEGFLPFDFKKKDGFKKSLVMSRQYGFYRQNYCGCEFSRRD